MLRKLQTLVEEMRSYRPLFCKFCKN